MPKWGSGPHGCLPKCIDCKRRDSREYHQKNPHVGWAADYRARARRFGFDPMVERFTRDEVVTRYGDACSYCGGAFEELDHWVPVELGGEHTLDNVRPSCHRCNNRKGRTDPRNAA